MSAAAVPPGWTVLAGTLQGEGGFGAVNGPFWERARPGEEGAAWISPFWSANSTLIPMALCMAAC